MVSLLIMFISIFSCQLSDKKEITFNNYKIIKNDFCNLKNVISKMNYIKIDTLINSIEDQDIYELKIILKNNSFYTIESTLSNFEIVNRVSTNDREFETVSEINIGIKLKDIDETKVDVEIIYEMGEVFIYLSKEDISFTIDETIEIKDNQELSLGYLKTYFPNYKLNKIIFSPECQ